VISLANSVDNPSETPLSTWKKNYWNKDSVVQGLGFEVYYESIKREPKIRGIKKCRCDERLQTKTKEFTHG
jgi:hypothetical protein